MPEELKNGANNNGAGDGAGAGQGGDGAGAGNGAGNGAGAGQGAGDDETVTIKKSELEQLKTDRDNYKEGLLRKKAEDRDLNNGGKGDGAGQGDGAGDGGNNNNNNIDEKKIGEAATTAANKAIRTASEKSAKLSFLKAHPEYVDDAQWSSLMSNLTFKGGELTHEEILDRMEAALIEHKRSTGKLDEYMSAERERGIREGRIQGELGSGHGAGGSGDKNEAGKGQGQLSEKGREMAQAMHTDPEKVAKVDPSKDNVISDLSKL